MDSITRRVGIFPGCSLEGSSSGFEASLEAVFSVLGLDLHPLKDWSCCGATSAHALDRTLHLGLNLRNLALAESQGYDEVLAPCAACYHRLASANQTLRQDDALLASLNAETGLHYGGRIKVRNVLDYLFNVVGVDRIRAQVKRPLKGLRAVCYYGCLNTRVPRMEAFDSVEYPMSMDHLVRSLGAQTADWSYKTECCGASLFLTSESVSAKLVSKILKDAVAHDAGCIVVACPMCQNNLDTKQEEIRAQFEIARPIPVVFITQLMGLAFGLTPEALKLSQCFVPFEWAGLVRERYVPFCPTPDAGGAVKC